MANKYTDTTYEVFCLSIDGSDVDDYGSLEKAEQAAIEWSQGVECEVVIEKVVRETIKGFKKGKEINYD